MSKRESDTTKWALVYKATVDIKRAEQQNEKKMRDNFCSTATEHSDGRERVRGTETDDDFQFETVIRTIFAVVAVFVTCVGIGIRPLYFSVN